MYTYSQEVVHTWCISEVKNHFRGLAKTLKSLLGCWMLEMLAE